MKIGKNIQQKFITWEHLPIFMYITTLKNQHYNFLPIFMYITMVIGDEWILKLFANFHKHHYWTIDCDEYLLKHFANFHVHHYGDKCQLKFFLPIFMYNSRPTVFNLQSFWIVTLLLKFSNTSRRFHGILRQKWRLNIEKFTLTWEISWFQFCSTFLEKSTRASVKTVIMSYSRQLSTFFRESVKSKTSFFFVKPQCMLRFLVPK